MGKRRLVPFNIEHKYNNIKSFQCGAEEIDRYVKRSLKQRIKRRLTQAIILQNKKKSFAILKESLFGICQSRNLPLQVLNYQHRGIGEWLFRDAILKSIENSKLSGSAWLYHLANEVRQSFYERLGFQRLRKDTPTPMFLPMKDILNNLP